jgi:ornithine cyclodeaminase/alanine dehydrogenase-like protein (mu-crystallin family)
MTLSETDVEEYLDPRELLDGLEEGFRGLELGDVQSPARTELSVTGKRFSLAMPAWRPGMQMSVKIVSVFDGNPSTGTTLGAVALGRKPGRISETEITVYNAMGVAMEDMVAANIAYQRARREGGGGVMAW